MSAIAQNFMGLILLSGAVAYLAFALLWRVGGWHIAPAATLTHDEGLAIGGIAPQIAAYRGDEEFHLSFDGGSFTLVVFGTRGCEPCIDLLEAATRHPITRSMRLIYVSNSDRVDLDENVLGHWELFRFHDETLAREQWRAPVSPYFHLIDSRGRIADKGVANHIDHLDRLIAVAPGVHLPTVGQTKGDA